MTRMIMLVMMVAATASAAPKETAKVPITAASEEARKLYLEGRDLFEKLRGTDAHALFERAVAKDPSFALAHLGVANTSASAKAFRESLDRAVALVDKVTPGEALLIRAADAAARGDLVHQREYLDEAVQHFPTDERVLNQLANYHFGNQDYTAAIAAFEKAIRIAPAFTQPYNQLGYAYRFVGKPAQAEKAFKKYIQLIPDDPNPYDSYGELLMERGRFEESIKAYKKALAVDRNFIASYIGIGNDQILLGRGEAARATFAKLRQVARNDGERRQAITWTALSYTHEAAWDKALAEVDKLVAIAATAKDLATLAGDHGFAAAILLEAGRIDAAATKYKLVLDAIDRATLPESVKQAVHRNAVASDARVALARGDLATAKAKTTEYGKQVAVAKVPFELRQHHELLGLIALNEKLYSRAVTELGQANPRDPRIMYWTAVALRFNNEIKQSRAMAAKAANFNGLAPNYGYVRAKAKALQ